MHSSGSAFTIQVSWLLQPVFQMKLGNIQLILLLSDLLFIFCGAEKTRPPNVLFIVADDLGRKITPLHSQQNEVYIQFSKGGMMSPGTTPTSTAPA